MNASASADMRPLSPIRAPIPVLGLGVLTAVALGIAGLGDGIGAVLRIRGRDAGAVERWSDGMVACRLVVALLLLLWTAGIRRNAARRRPQRRGPGWVFFGGLVPPAFLWVPFGIMRDAWSASAPRFSSQDEEPAGAVVTAWWTFWLLAWITGF